MIKLSMITALLFFFSSCSSQKSSEGFWEISLQLKDQVINFEMQIKKKKAYLFNGPETIELLIEQDEDKLILPIANYNTALQLEFKDDKVKGLWIKYDKIDYKVKLKGKRISQISSPNSKQIDLSSKWKIDFLDADKISESGILLFSQKNSSHFASVLTSTGDYRYLNPHLENNNLILSGFDGVFAFKLVGKIKENKIEGVMYAGKDFSQKFTASVNDSFELEDPTKITKISAKALNICLPELSGEKMCLNTFSKKIKIIQLFGSWCPNCIDETKFLTQYKRENPNSNVEYFIISFERSLNKESALKSLKKAKKLYHIDYPILVAGYTNETKVSDVLKGVDNFIAFPTMIIIDQEGSIKKVHAGFTGPATGKYYEEFKENFDQTIKAMLKK